MLKRNRFRIFALSILNIKAMFVKGVPRYWTDEKKEKVCAVIINEMCKGKSLNSIINGNEVFEGVEKMPDYSTFLDWVNEDKLLSNKYTRAQMIRADIYFDDIVDIADRQEDATVTVDSEVAGLTITTKDATEHRKVRIDSRKWVVSRMNPKKYSDKVQIDTEEFKEQEMFPDLHN